MAKWAQAAYITPPPLVSDTSDDEGPSDTLEDVENEEQVAQESQPPHEAYYSVDEGDMQPQALMAYRVRSAQSKSMEAHKLLSALDTNRWNVAQPILSVQKKRAKQIQRSKAKEPAAQFTPCYYAVQNHGCEFSMIFPDSVTM